MPRLIGNAENTSDLTDVSGTLEVENGGTGATTASDARTSLGLGTAATTAATDYATSAQGTTADSALQNLVEDLFPQLGGNLDVNGNSIVSVSAGNISITPDTTGKIILDGLSWPIADGNANQVLQTDGNGNLSFVNQSGGGGATSPTINSVTGDIFNGLSTNLTLSLTDGTSSVSVEFYANSTLLLTKSATVSGQSATVTVDASVYNQTAGTTISIIVVNSTGESSNQVNKLVIQPPSGGTISISGGYRYHKFTTSSTFTTYANFSRTVEYLVVAGGGGGGYDRGGGGGAGGLLQSSTSITGATSHTITIGGGGGANQGTNSGYGYNSSFGTIAIATGGGFGGNVNNGGGGGGSGGGGGYASSRGVRTTGQGNDGGYGQDAGGGGGGAGVAGSNANGQVPGDGGDGLNYSTWATATSSGDSGYYAGGGGGGRDFRYYQIDSNGGAGGGGRGGNPTGSGGEAGLANTGGGGGGGGGGIPSYNGAPGGSGIVIIRYTI